MGIIKTDNPGTTPDGAPDKRGPGNQDNLGSTGSSKQTSQVPKGPDMHTDLARGTAGSHAVAPGTPNKLSQPQQQQDQNGGNDDLFKQAQAKRQQLEANAGNNAPGSSGHDQVVAQMRALDAAQNKLAGKPDDKDAQEELRKLLA